MKKRGANMKICENGVIREMTAEEIVDYQTALECQKTLEFFKEAGGDAK